MIKKIKTKSGWGYILIILFFNIAIPIAALVGWGMCVYKLCQCDFDNKTSWKPEIIYGIGTCTGTGIIIGYLDLGE